ncbi:MAG: GTP-binding protein [Promethearchaeota archaeon]|nr:MAG: GTP-binding protein [Candidatus Lokiarchaeota archaeon]
MLYSATFKICIFGNGGVGKTTLIQKYISGRFDQTTKMTLGVDILTKRIMMDKWNVTLQIWDFGGEERFRFFLPAYARGSFGGIYMYDITRYNSLLDFDDWITIFKKGAGYEQNPIPIIMVGGKLDLEEKRAIFFEDAHNFSRARNINDVIECSSKTGQNIELIFKYLCYRIMKNIEML